MHKIVMGSSISVVLVIAIAMAFVQATPSGENQLLGVWRAYARGANTEFGTMRLTEKNISWGLNIDKPICTTTYTLESRQLSKTYKYNRFVFPSPVLEFTLYKIRFDPKDCAIKGAFQFAIPSDPNGSTEAEVIHYDDHGNKSSWSVFTKISK